MPTPVQSVQTRIYSGTIDPSTVNRTDEFQSITAIYTVAPDSTLEWEVDFYLQFQLDANTNRLVKLNDTFTLDTVTIYPIPIELQGLGIPMYGVMVGGEPVTLEVWAIQRGDGSGNDGSVTCDLTPIEQLLIDLQGQVATLGSDSFKRDLILGTAVGNVAVGLSVLSGSLSVVTGTTSLGATPFFGTSAALLGVGGALLP